MTKCQCSFLPTVFGDSSVRNARDDTLNYRNSVMEETDTLFNTAYSWDSYRGPLLPNSIFDFHRVAIHEFGHTLGLDHPDQAGQNVVAIMNSHIERHRYRTTRRHRRACSSIYNNGPGLPIIGPAPRFSQNISTRGFIGTGSNVLIGGFIVQGTEPATVILRAIGFSLGADGIANALIDPTITVYDSNQRQVAMNDDWASPAPTPRRSGASSRSAE